MLPDELVLMVARAIKSELVKFKEDVPDDLIPMMLPVGPADVELTLSVMFLIFALVEAPLTISIPMRL